MKIIFQWDIKNSLYCDVSIWSASTIFRRDHVAFNPFSEMGDPPIDTIGAIPTTANSPAGITDQNMLVSTLVSQRTSGVSLWIENSIPCSQFTVLGFQFVTPWYAKYEQCFYGIRELGLFDLAGICAISNSTDHIIGNGWRVTRRHGGDALRFGGYYDLRLLQHIRTHRFTLSGHPPSCFNCWNLVY